MDTASSKRRILIVDDDARFVEALVRELSEHNAFEIHAFTSGQAALEALQRMSFDLLITDWRIPDVDGLTLIREAKARSEETVAILVTAFGTPEMRARPEYALVQYHVEKPFTANELLTIVEAALPHEPTSALRPAHVFKVILGGDANVGKTSLIQRYCTGDFEPTRAMTIGVDFHVYDLQIEQMPLRLVVWDLGGQERFAAARDVFYRGAQAVGLVFDVSNRLSFYNLMRWWREVHTYMQDAPTVLLANKTDLPRQISREETAALAQAWNIPFFESSCVSGAGVAEFFEALARAAWERAR